MDLGKVFNKGGAAIITFLIAYIASHSEIITQYIPKEFSEMTVGAAVAGLLVALTNYLKHRKDK